MKHLWIFVGILALTLSSCKDKRPSPEIIAAVEKDDSLQKVIEQRDFEINEMMGTLNQIQEGFRQINEAEGQVTVMQEGEGVNKTEAIKESMQLIANNMERNRQLIKKLQQQLRESSFKGDQLKKTIAAFTQQLQEKDRELQDLRAQLDAKDIHITELDETINNLNTDVANLQTESQQKTETISNQDKQIHTAWFVYGTKNELKEQHILVDGDVLRQNFNKSYFTKIDIRVDKEIKLYSKSARLLTAHPSGSYTLTQDANKQYILRITNPDIFWSTSKYLVILVK